jgi:hypothetical protein
MRRHRFAAVLVIGWGIWVAGCGGKNPSLPESGAAADRAAIQRAIALAPELAVDFSDDAGELLGTAETAAPRGTSAGALLAPADSHITTATSPIHWGRRRVPSDRPPTLSIEFVQPPDSGRALVRITVRFDGWLFVDRTDDGLRNPGKKPLRDQATRLAMFRKVWFHADSASADSFYGWRLVALSPAEFTLTQRSRQTVTIHSVTLMSPRGKTTVTDPAALFGMRDGVNPLPAFRFGETVKVEARVTNSDTGYRPSEFVYLHVPINQRLSPGPFDRVRMRMSDDGTNGDASAGDGVYTAQWSVQDVGRHHLAVDVLNARSLQNETEDDYNSTTWGILYESYPTLLQ